MKKHIFRNAIIYVILLLVAVGAIQVVLNGKKEPEEWDYHKFNIYLKRGDLRNPVVRVEDGAYNVEAEYRNPTNGKSPRGSKIRVYAPQDSRFISDLLEADPPGLKFEKAKDRSLWITLFSSFLPVLVIGVIMFFMLNQQGGGSRVMNFGKSRARLYNEEKKRVTFDDVAGADEEKAELEEIVDFLKESRKFTAIGARIPKGILLVGPPGTGKTLLARAVAGEARVPFFSISGSDFVEMFVGVGASRVRDLFEQAKKNAPCIIFIDEIDAVGRQRGAGLGGGHDEREQTLNQLLVEMDGFDANTGIVMVAATNRPDILDPALLRPGRFDRQVLVSIPDLRGREAVLKVHARNKPLAKDVRLGTIAQRTTGFSGADLENVLNESALLAARHNRDKITMEEVDEAVDRVLAGPQKRSRVISPKERKIVAYHESGHVIVGYYCKDADLVHKVTIVPRGKAGGYAMMLPREDRYIATEPELLDRICGLLAGRVAEILVFDEVSTGASNDLERASSIARSMVMNYGMGKNLAAMKFGQSQGQIFLGRGDFGQDQNYSDAVAYKIDVEIEDIINRCYKIAEDILRRHREKLNLMAETLLVHETLDSGQIKDLLEKGIVPDPPRFHNNGGEEASPKKDGGKSKDPSDKDV
ncbi:ATP-dependent zinc metalloprotease FtsH [Pasteuria penetrans]|uniref:ATP-dependent zinc metalloprotease FtsH n=1 Tax=Pasteuria penetrans TaxID=86005 RepID=UPI000FBD68E5|nr:ATP-dependent zinc metalloprotease FtsH [Pasteuria penetrans]